MSASHSLLVVCTLVVVACAPGQDGGPMELTHGREDGFSPRLANPADRPGGTGACDRQLATVFGGPDTTAAASGFEPALGGSAAKMSGLDRSLAVGPTPNEWGHLFGYSMHIYAGSPAGAAQATLYIPSGFTKHTLPNGKDGVSLYYYPALGVAQNVTLAVYHLDDFGIENNNRNSAGSIRIGRLGGPGGDGADYIHSHLEVHRGWGLPTLEKRNETRVFFRDVFCPVDTSVTVPAAWKCDEAWFDEVAHGAAEAWCDCQCGWPDPDCAAGAKLAGCAQGQTCSSSWGVCVSK
jgi:hypothetical protein